MEQNAKAKIHLMKNIKKFDPTEIESMMGYTSLVKFKKTFANIKKGRVVERIILFPIEKAR